MNVIHITQCPVCGCRDFDSHLIVPDHSVTSETFALIRCCECGLVATQDHPGPGAIGRYYASEDYISHSDTQKGLVNRLYHLVRAWMLGKKRRQVERYTPTGAVLDIGAGTGYFLQHMRSHGWEVTGIEPDSGARRVAKDQFDLELGDSLDDQTLVQRQFDAVTLWHVIEHVHDLNDYLSQICGVLKPDGVVVIAVPNHVAYDARHYTSFWAGYDVPRHLWHFHPETMERLLSNNGLSVIRTHPMWFDALYVSMLSEKYKGSAASFLRGAIIGALSNLIALTNKAKASSVIYIAKLESS